MPRKIANADINRRRSPGREPGGAEVRPVCEIAHRPQAGRPSDVGPGPIPSLRLVLTVYRHAALADGTSPDVQVGVTVAVENGVVVWIGSDDDAPDPSPDASVIDAGGATIVPGFVDAHSHFTGPGGSHWVARFDDPTHVLRDVADHNATLAMAAGTRWFRDVGSPIRDGRALSLTIRDEWRGRIDRPHIRAAGTWIAKSDVLPASICAEASDADELVAAVDRQLDDGADLIKLYLDGPDRDMSPWTADEVRRATKQAHDRKATVTAHSTTLPGARAAVGGGVDCIEHGTELDDDLARDMADSGVFVVPTLAVLESWRTFGDTTSIERFTTDDNRRSLAERRERAHTSVDIAHRAGVKIAAGTDFGGGSARSNHMAWEVEALVAAGLEPHEALGAATWVGGDLLGEPSAGRIVLGGPADFFLVHGDPLSEPAALWRVWRIA